MCLNIAAENSKDKKGSTKVPNGLQRREFKLKEISFELETCGTWNENVLSIYLQFYTSVHSFIHQCFTLSCQRRQVLISTLIWCIRTLGYSFICMVYIGMCGPKGYVFSAVLVINRVSISAILVLNRIWFLYPSLELGMLFGRSYFSIIIDKTINKSPSKVIFGATLSAATVISRVSNFWSGHK